jgi:hypothetical protein
MTFQEVLAQVIAWLQRDKRVSYRALTRQFDLDEAYLDDVKYELIEIQQIAVDQDGKMLIWIGASGEAPTSIATPVQDQKPPPISYLSFAKIIPWS